MTAIVALRTKRFAVIAGDTLYSCGTDARYGSKIVRGASMAFGLAGEVGPLWRRLRTDQRLRDSEGFLEFFEAAHNAKSLEQSDRAQLESGAMPKEDVLCVGLDGISVTDSFGHVSSGIQIRHGQARLDATMEAIGSGRAAVLGYVSGYLAHQSTRDARAELRSSSRVESMLRAALSECARIDCSVGPPFEVEHIRK